MLDSQRHEKLISVGVIAAIVPWLYLSSLYSYLLFHSLIEIVTIAVAFALFILTWNTRAYMANSYLRLLGIGYAFIAFIDLLHTLAYKGMNVFPGHGANLPTQLWIAARYLQAVTLLAAPLVVERRLRYRAIFTGYAAAVAGLAAMIFSGNFPDCFIEGKGLTPFKIGSEYVISAALLASLYLFSRERKHFSDRVYFLVASSIAFTVISELSFTAYVSVYGYANMAGHFAKLAAFYLVYRAILVTGLRDPFNLVFRELKQTEEALRKAHDNLDEQVGKRTAELKTANEELKKEMAERRLAEEERQTHHALLTAILNSSRDIIIFSLDRSYRYTAFNEKHHEEMKKVWDADIKVGMNLLDCMKIPELRTLARQSIDRALQGEVFAEVQHQPGVNIYYEFIWNPVNQNGAIVGAAVFIRDITDRKRAEEALRKLNEELDHRVRERTAELEHKNAELERLNKLFVGRELKMIELKERIRKLTGEDE